MATPRADERFWSTTRGQIVSLLRRASRTVGELAKALDVTDNAIRAALATLERDGLVRPGARRPGVRKPNRAYELTAAGEALFPKAYGPILRDLLGVLTDRLGPKAREEVLRALALRLADRYRAAVTADDVRERVDQALAVLAQLGGLAEVEERDGRPGIRSLACPVADAVTGDREVCRVMERFLSELLGREVRQHCQVDPPRCAFALAPQPG